MERVTKLKEQIEDLLAVSALTLATTGLNGAPHAAPVYFAVNKPLRFYFFSDQKSQHSRDLNENPKAAAAIYSESQDWREIHGLQMRGTARRVEPGPEWDEAWEKYLEKFPFVAKLKGLVAQNELHVFIPEWIRLVDNRKGFGFKKEWDLKDIEKE